MKSWESAFAIAGVFLLWAASDKEFHPLAFAYDVAVSIAWFIVAGRRWWIECHEESPAAESGKERE